MSLGESYYPSDERYHIDHIEVVRIRPQAFEHEPPKDLVEDQWKVFDCPDNSAVCEVEFSDSDFAQAGRDALYYVRAIEEVIPTINSDNLRPQLDSAGKVKLVSPCYGDHKLAKQDQCHAPEGQRAWSSRFLSTIRRSKEGT